ncbi:hypothetical protein VPHD239_0092 [Vibrio phage D239]
MSIVSTLQTIVKGHTTQRRCHSYVTFNLLNIICRTTVLFAGF